MDNRSLSAILAAANESTKALHLGTTELREIIRADRQIRNVVEKSEQESPDLADKLQKAETRVKEGRVRLRSEIEKARVHSEEMEAYVLDYRNRSDAMASQPFSYGPEYSVASQQTIDQHKRLLERDRARLQEAIAAATSLLNEQVTVSKRPGMFKGLMRGIQYFLKELSIPIFVEMLFNKGIAITGITGFSIGFPVFGAALVGFAGLSLLFGRKDKSEGNPSSDLPVPKAVRPPLFPN